MCILLLKLSQLHYRTRVVTFTKGRYMVELRKTEHAVLSALKMLQGKATLEELASESKLSNAAIMRAAMVLQDSGLARIYEKKQTIAKLNAEGKSWANKSFLPERGTLNTLLSKADHELSISDISQEVGIPSGAIPVTLGWLIRKNWATIDEEKNTIKTYLAEPPQLGIDERLLELLKAKGQCIVEDLGSEPMAKAAQELRKRQLLDIETKNKKIIEITTLGSEEIGSGKKRLFDEVTQLTQELIVSGKWRNVKLQKYNIEASVAKVWPGKRHPYLVFLDEVRQKLVTMGFREMTGTLVELAFWNFDALYTPQDHPARQNDGIYYIKSPSKGTISAPKSIVANVKATHKNGWTTGSTGWGGKYSVEEAKRLILRGHGTCLSARTLTSRNLRIPGKYFSIARCYRPEVPDKTHLIEFNQVEGIIIDKDLTLRDLLGVLSKFATEIAGADKIKLKPDYFPFTEPSVELSAYKEGYGWIEFGGSGIFRPEVTLPLGIKEPVIAWGLGIDRLYMMRAGVTDIQHIFPTDLDWIRRKAVI